MIGFNSKWLFKNHRMRFLFGWRSVWTLTYGSRAARIGSTIQHTYTYTLRVCVWVCRGWGFWVSSLRCPRTRWRERERVLQQQQYLPHDRVDLQPACLLAHHFPPIHLYSSIPPLLPQTRLSLPLHVSSLQRMLQWLYKSQKYQNTKVRFSVSLTLAHTHKHSTNPHTALCHLF